jgi:protein SDA1
VHAIQNASFSKDTKIKVTALRFFLGMTFYDEEEEEEEEEEKQTIRAKLSVSKGSLKGVVKKRKKAEREMKRAQKKMNREDGKGGGSSVIDDCPAIFLLHDPQSYAERLFTMVKNSNESFQVRMIIMNVISRLIGSHRLVVLNYYPFLQKYMQPHQKNVTHILTYLAQASHPLVPPDVLQPCIRTLANHFVNDRSSAEVTAVGLNAIREICARAPLVMDSELLWDLVAYKKDKNKGVMMASRSIIALFRDINPNLLKRKERGKFAADFDENEAEFGFEKVRTDIVGADLLQQINQTLSDRAAGVPGKIVFPKGSKALPDDEWDLPTKDSDEEDDDEEDHGTTHKEINAYMRELAREENEDEDMEAKKTKASKGKKQVDEAEDMEIDEDGEDDEDEDDEDDGEEGEEMELGSDDEEGEEGEDEEDSDADAEDEESKPAPAKKRKTVDGSVATAAEPKEGEEKKEADGPAKPALPFGATKVRRMHAVAIT